MRYRNFDLELFEHQVLSDGTESIRVRVAHAQSIEDAQREAPATVGQPLRALLSAVDEGSLRRRADLVSLGTAIGHVLFPPAARSLFLKSVEHAKGAGEGLRVRIILDGREPIQLPWEYAYVEGLAPAGSSMSFQNFLGLNPAISIVRHRQFEGASPAPDAYNGPIRVVPLMASPVSDRYPPLAVDREYEMVRDALARHPGWELEARIADAATFQEFVAKQQTHVVHFAGHGEFNADDGTGSLILERGPAREANEIDAKKLEAIVGERGVRFAMLGACNSGQSRPADAWAGVAAAFVRSGVPVVVGMQFPVADDSALAFVRALYDALADRANIDDAMCRARQAILTATTMAGDADVADEEGIADWGVPVMYAHTGDSDDFVLFPAPKGPVDLSWNELVSRTAPHTTSYLNAAMGTDKRPGVYRHELYVTREAETKLASLLTGPDPAMILIGESGGGKTNMMCRWAEGLRQDGHAVLVYSCNRLTSVDIEHQIEEDLLLPAGVLTQLLPTFDFVAGAAQRNIILVFDALNEFMGSAQETPLSLLKRIDALASRLASDTRIRVVVTCASAAWNIMQRRNRFSPGARYASDDDAGGTQTLGRFTPEELDQAYAKYRAAFPNLVDIGELSNRVRDQIDTPLLLRILGEASREGTGVAASALDMGIIGAYYQLLVRRSEDQRFLAGVVDQMYTQRVMSVSVDDLRAVPELAALADEANADSSLNAMLQAGVVSERTDELQRQFVGFTFPLVGSFALARSRAKGVISLETIAPLVDRSGEFPLAWDAARMLLGLAPASALPQLVSQMASSPDPERRELAVSMLVERHRSKTDVKPLIRSLLASGDPLAQRTALKATYCIGAAARDIFVEAAERGNASLRQAVKDTLYLVWRNESPGERRAASDTLYLIWRRSPGFTLEFMRDLVARINPVKSFTVRRRVLTLFIELSVTIYINHCEKPEVIDQTVELYKELAKQLQLPTVKRLSNVTDHVLRLISGGKAPQSDDPSSGWPGPLTRILTRILADAFARPVLNSLFPATLRPSDAFFGLPLERRAMLQRAAPFVDPSTDLRTLGTDLADLLDADHQVFAVAGALVLSIHLASDYAGVEAIARELFATKNPRRRLWILFSLSVLLPETPSQWRELAEDLTRTFVRDHQDVFFGTKPGPAVAVLEALDFIFIPVGLACGKAGSELTMIRELIDGYRAEGSSAGVARCIRALAPVGFYYPEPVLRLLANAFQPEMVSQTDQHDALCTMLATLRTLHVDQVDAFVRRMSLEDLDPAIASASEVGRVQHYISAFGFFNNSVHLALHYPKMRKTLSADALTLLAIAPTRDHFLAKYARTTRRMFFDADFDLRRWITDDAPAPASQPRV